MRVITNDIVLASPIMKLSSHIAQGVCLGPVAYYLTDLRTAIVFSASVVLIDIDHYLHYIYRKKNLSIGAMFSFYDDVWDKRNELFGLAFLHTAEVLLLLLVAGHWYPVLRAVAAGFAVHMLFDFLHLSWHGVPFVRALSLIEYFIRKRRYSPENVW